MGSKNNPKNRGESTNKKVYNGKEIEPIMFVGTTKSEGKYVSAKYAKTNDIICDSKGKPVKWSDIKE